MRLKFLPIFLIILVQHFLFTGDLSGQPWVFQKERDGIKVYTRSEESNPVKSYKGEMDVHSTMEVMSDVIGNIKSFEWWDEGITEIKVLGFEKEKFIRYYLVYDVPWPFSDRDLCVESLITHDSLTGKRVVRASPLTGVIPEKPDLVRIINYWQQWSMQPLDNGMMHVILEGSVDPGGNIPVWIVNMVITDTPLNIMRKVREVVENK
jgi:hypothetical protein